jgi:hypothetical protein
MGSLPLNLLTETHLPTLRQALQPPSTAEPDLSPAFYSPNPPITNNPNNDISSIQQLPAEFDYFRNSLATSQPLDRGLTHLKPSSRKVRPIIPNRSLRLIAHDTPYFHLFPNSLSTEAPESNLSEQQTPIGHMETVQSPGFERKRCNLATLYPKLKRRRAADPERTLNVLDQALHFLRHELDTSVVASDAFPPPFFPSPRDISQAYTGFRGQV